MYPPIFGLCCTSPFYGANIAKLHFHDMDHYPLWHIITFKLQALLLCYMMLCWVFLAREESSWLSSSPQVALAQFHS